MNSNNKLQDSPNKHQEEDETKGRNIGTVLVNNNKIDKTDFKLSSRKKVLGVQ